MSRTSVEVRAAVPDDAEALLTLWVQLRGHVGRTAQYTPTPSYDRAVAAIEAASSDPSSRLFVAVVEGVLVGMAFAVLAPVSAMIPVRVVHVDYLNVLAGYERRGAGKALLAAATAFSDEVGSDHVLVNVLPGAREAHRFYARLGFQPVVTRRMAHVSVLRRRLGLETASSAHEGGSARRRAVLMGRRPLAQVLRRS